jgi:hypothetical protein
MAYEFGYAPIRPWGTGMATSEKPTLSLINCEKSSNFRFLHINLKIFSRKTKTKKILVLERNNGL